MTLFRKRIACFLFTVMMAVSSAMMAAGENAGTSDSSAMQDPVPEGTALFEYNPDTDRMVLSDDRNAEQTDSGQDHSVRTTDEIRSGGGESDAAQAIRKNKLQRKAETLAKRYAGEQNDSLHFTGSLVLTVPYRRFQLRLNRKAGKLSFQSSNKKVVRVSRKGIVTTQKAGVAVITAKSRKHTCHMVIYVARKAHNILRNAASRIDSEQSIKSQTGNRKSRKTIVLAGSSSFDRWTGAAEAFPGYYVVNSAIGGSKAKNWISVYSQLIVSYNPSAVVLFVGSNDIGGKGRIRGSECAERIQRLIGSIRRDLGEDVPIFYVSILYTWSRKASWRQEKESNRLMRQYCAGRKNIYFIDLTSKFLNKKGVPVRSLFLKDGQHPSRKGYAIFRTVIGRKVRKVLEK